MCSRIAHVWCFFNLQMFLSLLWCFVAVRGETSCEVADGVRNASLLQRGEVHEKVAMAADAVTKTLDMKPVLQCLRLTTPHIQHLKYPSDPEEHFEELRNALSPWFDYAAKKFMAKTKNPYHCTEGYCGPWVENHWIKHFLSTWVNHSSKTGSKKRLAGVFGPFIPIFMPYNDLWNANASEYEKMIKVLRKELRPHVAYITVVLHATGLVSNRKKMMKIMDEIPNVVVLSAGGYGHVPIPLFKQPEHVLRGRFFKAMSKRKLLLSYMGSSHHSPKDMRKKMINIVEEEAKSLGVKVHVGFGSADEWHRVAGNSRVSLCPRGFGRTAFHLFEILQLGLIPIHVYMGRPLGALSRCVWANWFQYWLEGLAEAHEEDSMIWIWKSWNEWRSKSARWEPPISPRKACWSRFRCSWRMKEVICDVRKCHQLHIDPWAH